MKGTPKKHRYSKKTRVLTIVGSSVLAVLGALCLTAAILINSVLGQINFQQEGAYDPNADVDLGDDNSGIEGEEMDPGALNNADVLKLPLRGNQDGVRNILLLGIDGTSYSGRSDTTMILSINDKTKTIKLVSLLRDTWVNIPGRDKDGDGKDDVGKLNAAYAYGRHTLQNKMIAQNFRLDIDDYIGVNFDSLPKVIDALGGLDINLTAKEMTQIPGNGCKVPIPIPGRTDDCGGLYGFYSLKGEPGVHHLSGFQAMQYARIRKLDSDFKRTARQREVVELIIQKAKKMSYSQMVSVMYKALDCVDTNMSADEFLGFAASAVTYLGYDLKTDYSVPKQGEYTGAKINGGAGLLINDPKTVVSNLHTYLYG